MALTILLFILLAGCPPAAQEWEAAVIFPNGEKFICEIADTPLAHGIGLSRHESLPAGRGMLFIYPRDERLSFWMPPEMRFNLDIIFLDASGRVIHIAHDVPPCQEERPWDCPSYGPEDRPGRYVVEIIGGTARKSGLDMGDDIVIELPKGYDLSKVY